MEKKKIAILTGGGDAPGINAVIYTLVRACHPTFAPKKTTNPKIIQQIKGEEPYFFVNINE